MLVLEIILAFGPATLLWMLGLGILPMLLFSNEFDPVFRIAGAFCVIAGGLGIFAVLQSFKIIVMPRSKVISPKFRFLFLLLGLVALLVPIPVLAFSPRDSLPAWFYLIFIAPALVIMHLAYLTRGLFEPSGGIQ